MSSDQRGEAYDPAQICTNGHVTSDSANQRPQRTADHCSKCGAETIARCLTYGAKISGDEFGGQFFVPYRAARAAVGKRSRPWRE
jgi:hypothetical protein